LGGALDAALHVEFLMRDNEGLVDNCVASIDATLIEMARLRSHKVPEDLILQRFVLRFLLSGVARVNHRIKTEFAHGADVLNFTIA